MNLRTLAMMLAFGASAVAAPVPKELKVRSDAERREGLWKVGATDAHWLFRGDKLFAGATATPDTNGHGYRLTVRPDAFPPQFDIGGTNSYAGIYKFVGDDLHVAYSAEGKARPVDFSPGGSSYIEILKRVPEGKK